MQGTLDFTCGIYAVVNALSCIYGLELSQARKIFRETLRALSGQENIWSSLLCNETDHYWLVRWLLGRWCMEPPWQLDIRQPFAGCLLPDNHPDNRIAGQKSDWTTAALYLPEKHAPRGPACASAAQSEALAVWDVLAGWLDNKNGQKGLEEDDKNARAAILRFHRFVPGSREPLVSHWTTARAANDRVILLHDASAEPGALFVLERGSLLPGTEHTALVRIAPESVVLLSRCAKGTADY
jgi:hypothetical protein